LLLVADGPGRVLEIVVVGDSVTAADKTVMSVTYFAEPTGWGIRSAGDWQRASTLNPRTSIPRLVVSIEVDDWLVQELLAREESMWIVATVVFGGRWVVLILLLIVTSVSLLQ